MRACRRIAGLSLIFLATFAVAQKSNFEWDWHNQEVIGRADASVGNTSKLTESERSSLVDAIVLRLQKPMGDAGYDDDRIREIATTTRIRFIDVGAGQPLIFTTSLGLEGGCDALSNCPLWVFRRTDEGFLSLLNTIAASYTPEPTESGFEVVFLHHVSEKESGLTVYRLADDKLSGVGCYTALWPKPSGDPNQLSDPKIEPCKQSPLLESAHPVKPEASETPAPAATVEPAQQPATEQPAAQPKSDSPETKPESAEPKEQAPQAEQPKSDSVEPKEQAPPPPESTNPEAPPNAPDQQTPAQNSDQAQPPSAQPAQDAKPEPPPADTKPDQAQPDTKPGEAQPAPDQSTPKADQPQQPPSEQPAPKADEPAPAQDQPTPQTPPANPEPAAPPPSSDAK